MNSDILEMLIGAEDYVSGEELSRKLGVSRTAVWKKINALRKEGYVIESATKKGYKLKIMPDLLNKKTISSNLDTNFIGKEIDVMRSVDSTNEEIKRRASAGAESGLIVAADEQTSGKGRLGRVWESDSGGIYFTILIRPELSPNEISAITLAAGYAVCLAIREYTELDAKIKWPNDIIIGSKKICGILTEMAAQTDRVDYVAIGIGINVNHESFPGKISGKASSLYLELGKKLDRNDFFRCVIKKLDKVLSDFLVSFSSEDLNEFRRLCATIGRNVSVKRNGILLEGKATDLTPGGELVITDNSGKEYIINSGEVTVQGIY